MNIDTILFVIEFLGTFAFAVSGIRSASSKRFDWFGGYVVGLATAIGGGTMRDVMLGVTPFWMTDPIYLECTGVALLSFICMKRSFTRLSKTWALFDTLGLALFTIAGVQKSLSAGFPFWVAIMMGCITGAAGGVMRDVLVNEVPLIFRKEIYALACIAGGIVYQVCYEIGLTAGITTLVTFATVVIVRILSVKYHVSLPILHDGDHVGK